MADFSKPLTEDQREAQLANPFQPTGLAQLTQSWNPAENAKSPFAPQTYPEASKAWYGGRNTAVDGTGESNGWDTAFMNETLAQQSLYYNQAVDEQDSRKFFDWLDTEKNPEATGVALWNDSTKGITRGDVWVRGQKQENIYDLYDKETADLLMSAFITTGPEAARINESGGFGDGGARVRARRVEDQVAEYTDWLVNAESAGSFKDAVERRKEQLGGNVSAFGSFAAGAGAGAASGATLGLLGGPLAPLTSGAGAVIGGLFGGAAAWLNRDQITEVTARNVESTIMAATDEGGDFQDKLEGVAAGVSGVGKVAMISAQPFTNTVQGLFDGADGDGVSDFYAIDPATGRTKPGLGWEVANFLSTGADALLQFGNPAGRGLYMGSMGSVVAGDSANLALSDSVFNERTGLWDDLEGPQERLSAYGSVGIDLMQMGTVRGFANRTKSLQEAAGLTPRNEGELAARIWQRLPGGGKLENAVGSEVVAGRRVFRDAEGKILDSSRASIQVLAPSEAVRGVVVGWRARNAALPTGMKATVDDFYRANYQLAILGSRWSNAMLTGFAEGAEEAVQGILDPMATGDTADGWSVAKSAALGFSAGAGMALGAQMFRKPDAFQGMSDQQLLDLQRAKKNFELAHNMPEMSMEEFAVLAGGFGEENVQRLAAQSETDARQQGLEVAAAQQLQMHEEGVRNPLGFYVQNDIRAAEEAKGRTMPNGMSSLVLLPKTVEYVVDADGNFTERKSRTSEADFSFWQVVHRYAQRLEMEQAQGKSMQVALQEAQQQLAAANETGDANVVARFTEQVASIEQDIADQQVLIEVVEIIAAQLAEMREIFVEAPDTTKRTIIEDVNRLIRAAADGQGWTTPQGSLDVDPEIVQRAAEIILSRQPLQDRASKVRFVPQISLDLTARGAHGEVHVDQSTLKAINGDHDGDTVQDVSGVYMPRAAREALRRGGQFYQTVTVENEPDPLTGQVREPFERLEAVLDNPDGEELMLEYLTRRSLDNGPRADLVSGQMDQFARWFRDRYSEALGAQKVDAALVKFFEMVGDGNPKARKYLIDTLLNLDVTAFLQVGEEDGVQEIPHLSSQISFAFEAAQRKLRLYDYANSTEDPATEPAAVRAATAFQDDIVQAEAATLGAQLSLLLGPNAQRSSQKLNYLALLRAAVGFQVQPTEEAQLQPSSVEELARAYMLLTSGTVDTAMDEVDRLGVVTGRVQIWLANMANEIAQEIGVAFTTAQKQSLMMVVAQSATTDFDLQGNGTFGQAAGTITVAQLLLRRSIQMEQLRYEREAADSDMNQRLTQMLRLTKPQKEHSYSESAALIEIFGSEQLETLLGPLHASVGPNLTLAQLGTELTGVSDHQRGVKIRQYKNGIGYLKHRGLGDPPLDFNVMVERLREGTINGYTILIDALAATAHTNFSAMEKRNETQQKTVEKGFGRIASSIDSWASFHAERLTQDFPNGATRRDLLLDRLQRDPEFAQLLTGMFPAESRLATFAFNPETGEIVLKAWVMEVLTETDPKKAALKFHVNTLLDRMQQHGATMKAKDGSGTELDPDSVDGIEFASLDSRMLQTIYIAMYQSKEDAGFAWSELQRAMFGSNSIEEMYERINGSPMLLANRQKLLPWYDDLADFEVKPNDIFNSALPGAAARDNFLRMVTRLDHMDRVERDQKINIDASMHLVQQMRARYDELGGTDAAVRNRSEANANAVDEYLDLMLMALEQRRMIPDTKGINAYDQAIEAVQQALLELDDKAAADERIQALGEVLVANATMGRKPGLLLEMDNVASLSFNDVAANLSLLANGPVRIMYDDGRVTPILDLSTGAGILEALSNKATHFLARAVLLPTTLDIDLNNSLQLYSMNSNPADLGSSLRESTFQNLFNPTGKPSVKQAYSYIGYLESTMLKQAMNGTDVEQAAASYPISHLIHDVIIAYMHSPDAVNRSDEDIRHQVVVDVADAIMRISAISDSAVRQQTFAAVREEMLSRVRGRDPVRDLQLNTPELYDGLQKMFAIQAQQALQSEASYLETRLADTSLTPEEREAAQAEYDRMTDLHGKDPMDVLRALSKNPEYLSIEAALQRFAIDETTEETKAASIEQLLDYIGSFGRLNRFLSKDTLLLVDQVHHLIRRMAEGQIDPRDVSSVDWAQLTTLAASMLVSESSRFTGSNIKMMEMPTDDPINQQYFDTSFSYLANTLFSDEVFNAARVINSTAPFDMQEDSGKLAQRILGGLLKEKRLGQWSTTVQVESMKVRKAVNGAPAGPVLQEMGSIPKFTDAYVNAGMVSFAPVNPAEHHSTYTITGTRGQSVDDILKGDTSQESPFVKLENHFVFDVVLTSPQLQGPVSIKTDSSVRSYIHDKVSESPYTVLSLDRLQGVLDALVENDPTFKDFSIEITYVDVDKRPPTDEYANNIFFDGPGRQFEGNGGIGPIAATFYATGGINKIGQQRPLDFMKSGFAFYAYQTQSFAKIKQLENEARSVTELMHLKAMHLWRLKYETGHLLRADLPAMYKLVKFRHVVKTADGSIMWPEQFMALERMAAEQGEPMPQGYEVIPLSDAVAKTLMQDDALDAVPGSAQGMPYLTRVDGGKLPPLDAATLERLGLSDLGAQIPLAHGPAAQVRLLSPAGLNPERGASLRSVKPRQMTELDWNTTNEQYASRQTATAGNTVAAINERNFATLNSSLALEQYLPRIPGTPVEMRRVQDVNDDIRAGIIGATFRQLLISPNSILWVLGGGDGTQTSGMPRGLLTPVDVANGFKDSSTNAGLAFGDGVAIDLVSLMERYGSDTFGFVTDALRKLSSKGVKVSLIAKGGGAPQLRGELADWIVSNLHYAPIAGSSYFFEPITEYNDIGAAARAEMGSLLTTMSSTGNGLSLLLVNPTDLTLNEAAAMLDYDRLPQQSRWINALAPVQHTVLNPVDNPAGPQGGSLMFGLPRDGVGTDSQLTRVRDFLLPLLTSKDADATLKKLASGGTGSADPQGLPVRKLNPDGSIDPGVRSFEDAKLVLADALRAGKLLIDRELVPGDLIPIIDSQNHMVLVRYGFEWPGDLMAQFNDREAQEEIHNLPGSTETFKLAIYNPKMVSAQTTYPPFKVERLVNTSQGLRIRGSYDMRAGKLINEGQGTKLGPMPYPDHIRPDQTPLSSQPGNSLSVVGEASAVSVIGKGGTEQLVDNFRNAFALFGISFEAPLLDFFGRFYDTSQLTEGQQLNNIRLFLSAWANANNPMIDESEMRRLIDTNEFMRSVTEGLRPIAQEFFPEADLDALVTELTGEPAQEDVPSRITSLLMATLLMPGINLSHVIGSTGFMNVSSLQSNERTQFLPTLLTDSLDSRLFPATRDWLFQQMNSRLPRDPQTGKPLYKLDSDWTFSYTARDQAGRPEYRSGTLAMVVLKHAEENPLVQTQSQIIRNRQSIKSHTAGMVRNMTDGGRLPLDARRAEGETGGDELIANWFRGDDMIGFKQTDPVPPMQALLPKLREVDKTFNSKSITTYLEQRVIDRADERLALYTQPIEKDPKDWDRTLLVDPIRRFVTTLNLQNLPASTVESMIDLLVRQHTGSPGRSADQDDFIDVGQTLYLETLSKINQNLDNHMNPLLGSAVPLPHARLFLERVFQENQNITGASRWAPLAKAGQTQIVAKNFDEWVEAIFGQVLSSSADFESMFSSDFNGFWQSYIAVTPATMGLPITPNTAVNSKLASVNNEEGFSDMAARWEEVSLNLSPNPGVRSMLRGAVMLESVDATLDAMIGKDQTYNGAVASGVARSATAANDDKQASWRASNQMAKALKPSMRDYASEGRVHIHKHVTGTKFGRMLINVSLINRLLNPAIWISGIVEVPVNNTLQNLSDLLTGQSIGATGKLASKAGAKVGAKPAWTPEQIDALRDLAESLGSNKLWMAELANELNYRAETLRNDPTGSNGLALMLEKAAGTVIRTMSDPRYGPFNTKMAQQYIVGALEYIRATNQNVISVDQFIELMSPDNPLALKQLFSDQSFGPHTAGLNRMAQTRAMKPTVTGKVILAPIHWMMSRNAWGVRFGGELLFIPFAFTNFNANRLTTFTGMAGWDQAIAMFFDARKKRPAFLDKDGKAETFDLTDVIETIDLQRTFIRSGVTFSMLMTLGLMAGNIGLGGGDEEDERRRRLSKYLQIPNYLDPREPENSFTFAQALYLDKIPFLGDMFTVPAGDPNNPDDDIAAVVPHWIVRQFTSPIIGMSRFFETGDVREIYYGFRDAYSAFPNSFEQVWNEGDKLAEQLLLQAREEADIATGSESAPERTTSLLIRAVGVLERALIENAFLNSLAQAGDEWDRNPYLYARTEADGSELDLTQGTKLPKPTNALVDITVGEGENEEVQQAYIKRTGMDARLHAYAKNNTVFAHIAGLFTGGSDSSYLRKNMPIKEVTIQREETPDEIAKGMIFGAYAAQGGQFKLSENDIVQVLKRQIEATGERWNQADVEAKAKIIYDANNGSTALTEITQEGQEILTRNGQVAVIKSIWKEGIPFGHPSLQGIAITQEQRDEIAEEMLTQIKQDAINLGLGSEGANYVMNRIWYGDTQTGAVGLKDVIYSREVPLNNTLKYNQLNVMFELGPDGRPWATPFTRQSVFQAAGIPMPHTIPLPSAGTYYDAQGKVVDDVAGINTGLHALVRKQTDPVEPTLNDSALDKVAAKDLTPDTDPYYTRKKYGSGSGGGGGYSNYGRPYFTRMDDLRWGTVPNTERIPFINTNSPYVRRSRINRERVFSDRGRLNQWQ